jgi:metal-dependent HD superfamily phosphatase/phosphodiesterase
VATDGVTEGDAEEVLDEALALDSAYGTLLSPGEAVAGMHIRVPARGNRKLRKLLEKVSADEQVKAWWHVANVNAVVRLEINDHSWVHIQIVTNIALKLLRQLTKNGVQPSLVADYRLSVEDSEVVVVLASLLHDIGMSVHRRDH